MYAYFVTLTYDTMFVPVSNHGFMTLDKSDLQRFFKRLRKCKKCVIKYYAVGEYGSKTMRPHYHVILLSDVFISEKDLLVTWQKGLVHVGSVTTSSIAYTLKYIDKPFKKLHDRDDRLPNFSLMSKRLGLNYLTQRVIDYHVKNSIPYVRSINNSAFVISLPRYYRDKIFDAISRTPDNPIPNPFYKSYLFYDLLQRRKELASSAKASDEQALDYMSRLYEVERKTNRSHFKRDMYL